MSGEPRGTAPDRAAGAAGTAGGSPLRLVLAEIRASGRRPATLDEIARRVGVDRDEVASMIDYWVRRGRLRVDEIGRGCAGSGCAGCPSAHNGVPHCGTPATGGPVLLAISPTAPARPVAGPLRPAAGPPRSP